MGIGIIIVGGLLLALVAFGLLLLHKTRQLARMRMEMLHALGMVLRSHRPVIADGEIHGMRVLYEHHNYRSDDTRAVVPCLRVTVESHDAKRPPTALCDKTWNVAQCARPDVPQGLTGDAELDARYDAYGADDQSLALWGRAMGSPIIADTLRNPQRGRVRQIEWIDGRLTLIADRFCRMDRQRRIIEAAVELAST